MLTPLNLPYVSGGNETKATSGVRHSMIRAMAAVVPLELGGGAEILHGFRNGKRALLWVPLCERHVRTAWWHSNGMPIASLLSVLLAVVFGVLDFCTRWQNVDWHWVFGLAAISCFILGLLIRARNHDGFIYAVNVTDEDIELGGVSAEFLREWTKCGEKDA